MLQKIITEAGFTVISLEDRQCLLNCVENLQLQRDQYRDLLKSHLDPEAGKRIEDVITRMARAEEENRKLSNDLYLLKLKTDPRTAPGQPHVARIRKSSKRARRAR